MKKFELGFVIKGRGLDILINLYNIDKKENSFKGNLDLYIKKILLYKYGESELDYIEIVAKTDIDPNQDYLILYYKNIFSLDIYSKQLGLNEKIFKLNDMREIILSKIYNEEYLDEISI